MKNKSRIQLIILGVLVAWTAFVLLPIFAPQNRDEDNVRTSLPGKSALDADLLISPDVKTVVNGNNTFAIDLYQQLKTQQGNLFFSPYSIYTSLAMTYAGARGQTETEMVKMLHFTLPQQNLHAAFGEMMTQMEEVRQLDHIAFGSANSLWCQENHQFTEAFLDLVRKDYGADACQVDFKNSPQAAGAEINKWIAQKTGGKINDTIAPNQLTRDIRLVLCSAVYFKGQWQAQFKAKDTKPMPFYVSTNQTVTVPMMYQDAKFKTTRSVDQSVEMLELPYSGNNLSMIILLPMQELEQTLPDLEQRLTTDNLRTWLASLDQVGLHKTSVFLPRFITSQCLDLEKELGSLGMTIAFDGNADFSGMDGTTNLFVSSVNHEAFIEVNEEGTEASAVTHVNAHLKSAAVLFKADHPFIFLIRENHTGTILFLGRITDPTK